MRKPLRAFNLLLLRFLSSPPSGLRRLSEMATGGSAGGAEGRRQAATRQSATGTAEGGCYRKRGSGFTGWEGLGPQPWGRI